MATTLAIETSCDETAAAIVKDRQVLANVVASQIKLHATYGGIVPELAARAHVETIDATIDQAVRDSGLAWSEIDAIAATCAPGLVGSLLVGLMAGKTIALVRQKPFLGIHHLEGHICASSLADRDLQTPFLCLLVSGGHTSLIVVKDWGEYETIGQTRDDAAGEAFDKVARLMGLGYPGGPVIDRLAAQGDATAFKLPEGRVSLPEGGFHPYDTSFSGLKTAVGRVVEQWHRDRPETPLPVADLAASFQSVVVKALVKRTLRAAEAWDLKTIAIGGGVAANRGLRSALTAAAEPRGLRLILPSLEFCTDNAAMIACAANEHFRRGRVSPLNISARSRLSLAEVLDLYAGLS